MPSISAHAQGRDILLVSNCDIGEAIKEVNKQDSDVDALYLAKAANVKPSHLMAHFGRLPNYITPATFLRIITLHTYDPTWNGCCVNS